MRHTPKFNGALVRDYLQREHRKRKWLALQVGISTSYLDQILRGRWPSSEVVERIAKVIRAKVKDLEKSSAHLASTNRV